MASVRKVLRQFHRHGEIFTTRRLDYFIFFFQYTMHFLLNHPELKGDICDTLKARQHDPEETVRYEVVMAIVSVSKKDMQVVAESEELLNFVKERTLDKKFKIRKEAISGKNYFFSNLFLQFSTSQLVSGIDFLVVPM